MDLIRLNLNNSNGTAVDSKVYVMPPPVQLVWISMFLLVTIVGTIGNVTVIWIVLAHRHMRSVANLFIVNLALADTFSSLLNVIATSYSEIFINWPFGRFYCKFNEGIASCSVCVSVITLAVLSIERYNAIITPFKPRMRRRAAILLIVLIWCVSLVITIPHWNFVEVEEFVENGEHITFCVFVWTRMNNGEMLKSIYSTFFMIITYFLPLACITFTYGRVAIHLWGAETIGEDTELHLKQRQAKQKVVKMMIIVVIVFAICWLPIHLFFIFRKSDLPDTPFYNNLFLAVFWLAMSNSMYNPIIYCWMNDKFRTGFKNAFRCCLCMLDGSASGQIEMKL